MIPNKIMLPLENYLNTRENPDKHQVKLLGMNVKNCNKQLEKLYHTEMANLISDALFEMSNPEKGVGLITRGLEAYDKAKKEIDNLFNKKVIDKETHENKLTNLYNMFKRDIDTIKNVYGMKNQTVFMNSLYLSKPGNYFSELLNNKQFTNQQMAINTTNQGTDVIGGPIQKDLQQIESEANKKLINAQNAEEQKKQKAIVTKEMEGQKAKAQVDMKVEPAKAQAEMKAEQEKMKAEQKIKNDAEKSKQQILTRNMNMTIR